MSISRRTVFYDNTNGVKRFWDWALVLTDIGTMVEPFMVNNRFYNGPSGEFDPTDEICRIDEIRSIPIDKQQLALSGGDHHLHGGVCIPRDGR